jgi:hypothetical protein
MGYTHYVRRPVKNAGSAYFYGKLALDAKAIVDYANANGIRIRDAFGEGEASFGEFEFALNGDASSGHDYETFYWAGIPEQAEWRKGESHYFSFCKTAMRPYDAVVTAILIRAKTIYGSCAIISSDGDWETDWQEGRRLYEAVFGEVAPCPMEMANTQ